MLHSKLRMRFFKKIAQEPQEVLESIQQEEGAETTDTALDSKIKNLSAPETFAISNRNPSLRNAFTAPVVAAIDVLSDKLNTFLHYISLGKYNMKSLINEPSVGATDITSKDFRPLFSFSKNFFEAMNSKFSKDLSREEFQALLSALRKDPSLNNLSATAASSELQNKIQVNNIKSFIISSLDNLNAMAPSK